MKENPLRRGEAQFLQYSWKRNDYPSLAILPAITDPVRQYQLRGRRMIAIFLGLLLMGLVVTTAWRLACSFQSITTIVITAFFFAWAEIVLIGFSLSALHLLNSTLAWVCGAMLGFVVTKLSCRFLPPATSLDVTRVTEIARKEWSALSLFQKLVLGSLAIAAVIALAANFALAVAVAPSCWDTLTYHLPRVAYFLQFGSLDYFPANYVYQNAHAKDGSLLLMFAFLGSGRHENAMQFVQFVGWCIGAATVYGLARKAGSSRFASTVCGLLFMLLPECVMEASTCQNDLLVAVCGAGAAYLIFDLRNARELWLAGLPVGLGFGTKISFLPTFVSLVIVVVSILPGLRIRRVVVLLVGIVASISLFSLPAGYAANFRRFGNPVGTPTLIAMDSNANRSALQTIKLGEINLVRFGFEFFSLDGFPRQKSLLLVQHWMRAGPAALAERMIGPRLQTRDMPNLPAFDLERRPKASEDSSYWGPLGFLFIWPIVFLIACRTVGTRAEAGLALAAIAFVCALAVIHPYDPTVGRFMLSAAPFACAAAGSTIMVAFRKQYSRYWIVAVVVLGAFAAICGALFRSGRSFLPFRETPSIFALDRLSQMTVRHPAYRQALHMFDAITPRDATVAVLLPPDSYEFPLFGEGLTRRLLPATTEWRERGALPESAQYAIFSTEILSPDQTDIALGQDWYLRRLK